MYSLSTQWKLDLTWTQHIYIAPIQGFIQAKNFGGEDDEVYKVYYDSEEMECTCFVLFLSAWNLIWATFSVFVVTFIAF